VARDYAQNLPRLVLDSGQMRQVFLNLAMNAAEAMPDGGTLTVATRLNADGQTVTIAFSDTGSGIAEENLGKLFTPFFTTKQLGKGTGLGLSIAYGIVKMHRGQIQVHSKLGSGTTFLITLPLQVPPSEPYVG
jgi:two-component system NtrC family sensor kinase